MQYIIKILELEFEKKGPTGFFISKTSRVILGTMAKPHFTKLKPCHKVLNFFTISVLFNLKLQNT